MIQYAAVAALIIAIAAFFIGRENGLSEYHELRATLAAQQKQAEADAEAARIASERVTAEVSQSWAAALDWQRTHGSVVRVRSSGCETTLRPVSDGSFGLAATGPQLGFSPSVDVAAKECEARLNAAVEDAAQLTWLQHWVEQQSKVAR